MAKNTVEIDVRVDDKGTTQKLALDSKKAGEGLDKVSRRAGEADRNLKGAAQASANGTKNFSKMSQGMGGLVGAYASLAAQVFALSAAYNFLKSAGDLKVLEAGQKAYATTTGVALRVLANDVIAATDAQIRFADASQAVAIGTAAGLQASQLRDLGKAAKDVSLVLGRDVTDSFNRLIRGVTKAEPELLDELGVILRLKTATEKYALTLGKSANDLTDFERSQAVAVDVLDQVEKKYSSMLESFNVSTNTYNKLGKALDDVLNQLKELVDFVAKPFAEVLSNTPALAIAGFALLLKGPLAAMGVNLNEISAEATKSAEVYKRAAAMKVAAAERVNVTIDQQKQKLRELSAEAAKGGTQSKLIQQFASGGALTPTALATLKRATDAAIKNTADGAKVASGIWKGYSKEIVLAYQKALLDLELAEKKKVTGTEKNVAKMKATWATLGAQIRSVGASILSFGMRLLSIAGWASIAATTLEAMGVPVTDFIKNLFTTKKEASTFEVHAKRIAELNKEYELVNEKIKEYIQLNPGKAAAEGYKVLGNVIGSVDTKQFTAILTQFKEINKVRKAAQAYQMDPNKIDAALAAGGAVSVKAAPERIELTAGEKEAEKFVQTQITAFKQLNEQAPSEIFQTYITQLEMAQKRTNGLSDSMVQALIRSKASAEAYGKVIENLPRTMNEATASFRGFVQSIAPLSKDEETIQSLSKAIKDLTTIKTQSGLTDENQAMLDQYKEELTFVENIYKRRLQSERDLKSLQIENNKRLREATELMKAQVSAENSRRENLQKIRNLDAEARTIAETIVHSNNKMTDAQKRRLILLGLERQALEEANRLVEKRIALEKATLEERTALQKLQLDTRVIEVQQNMLSMLEREKALKQQILDITEADQKAAIDRQTRGLGRFQNKERFAAEKAYELELKLLPIKKQQVIDEFDIKMKQIDFEYDLLEAKKEIQANELRILAEQLRQSEDPNQRARAGEIESLADRVAGQDFSDAREMAKELARKTKNSMLQGLLDNLDKLKEAKEELSATGRIADALEESLGTGLTNAIGSVIQGTASLKQAFASFVNSTLQMLSQLIAQMIAMKILGTAIGMFGFGSPVPSGGYGTPGASAVPTNTGILAARTGGMFSNGKSVPGYAVGGISKGPDAGYPVTLHGTEAVVPLPNGKSIPVDMKGSGQNNNVVVNVSVDNQGRGQTTTESQSGAEAGNLGQAIARAVQQELQNQKRSGGILNPYGVA